MSLKSDKWGNWDVKKGDKVIYKESTRDDLIQGEEYEVDVPQGTPSGIRVKNNDGKQIWAEHSWFWGGEEYINEKRSQSLKNILNDESRNTI